MRVTWGRGQGQSKEAQFVIAPEEIRRYRLSERFYLWSTTTMTNFSRNFSCGEMPDIQEIKVKMQSDKFFMY